MAKTSSIERFAAPTDTDEYDDVLFYCMDCDAFSEHPVNSEYMTRSRKPYCMACKQHTAIPMPLLRQVGFESTAKRWTAHTDAIDFIVKGPPSREKVFL